MLPLESLFRDLNERGGRYVVVGGLAVVLHGHLRATGDVDLVVDFADGQVDRTLAALEHPLSFDQLWSRSLVVIMRDVPVRIAYIDDLIALKRQAGRPEDLTDVQALAEIQRLRAGEL